MVIREMQDWQIRERTKSKLVLTIQKSNKKVLRLFIGNGNHEIQSVSGEKIYRSQQTKRNLELPYNPKIKKEIYRDIRESMFRAGYYQKNALSGAMNLLGITPSYAKFVRN